MALEKTGSRRQFVDSTTQTYILNPSINKEDKNTFFNTSSYASNSHRWPPTKATKDSDLGGGFYLEKTEWLKLGKIPFRVQTPSGNRQQFGFCHPFYSGGSPPTSTLPTKVSDAAMNAAGATAIARTLPTAPLSGVGQFIGELKDLPKFAVETWKNRAASFRNLAKHGSNDYLNVQFGWIPFVNDIIDFCQVTQNSTKHIQQFLRDSGRTVRRRTELPTLKTTSVDGTYAFTGVPPIDGLLVQSNGIVTQTTETEVRKWFSGAYVYYVPRNKELFDPKTGKIDLAKVRQQSEQLANRLYGTRITPHLLWQLAPWSWAVDWVSNAGDVVKNFSAFGSDNLVLKYGYIMAKSTTTRTYSVTRPMQLMYGGGSVQGTQQIRGTVLQRFRATPYGFGLSPGSFSARQWSIIGALGISKAPRSLSF